jgi:hypothetical protein
MKTNRRELIGMSDAPWCTSCAALTQRMPGTAKRNSLKARVRQFWWVFLDPVSQEEDDFDEE